LQHLRRFGLVEARREGKRVIYRLADPEVVALLGALSQVTQRNVGAVEKVLNSYFRERDNLEPVSRRAVAAHARRSGHADRPVPRRNSRPGICQVRSICL
jgi:ArsR family transcriptional regulator